MRDMHAEPQIWGDIHAQLAGVFQGETDALANAANMAAVLFHGLHSINWAGFYLLKRGELVLGPFQGKVACVRIGLGHGVCGTAAVQRHTVRVADVAAFPGHIACDAASRSEIVVPLLKAEHLWGVLDLDSPSENRFDADDERGLERAVALYLSASNLDYLPGYHS